MAHILRGKQAGIQGDLSAGISPDLFAIDDIARFGVNSQVSQIVYDPVQGLLAVGTNDTRFGRGQIYVFGGNRVQRIFPLARNGASVRVLQFCADKLLCLDSKNDFSVFSLESGLLVKSYSPPAIITAMCSDPALDYALLGTHHGEVLIYDTDREGMAPLRIPNMWQEINPRVRMLPVVSLALHPRDIGTLLIGYTDGAAIYSFKQNKSLKFFQYKIPRGAPGGDANSGATNLERSPKLIQALWHPTGTFVLTGHEDASLVFWDPKDGRVLQARTTSDTNIDRPGLRPMGLSQDGAASTEKEPLYKIAWCANQDPDDTAVLIAGGLAKSNPVKGLTLLEFGRTPNYATSSWEVLSDHIQNPKHQKVLPTPPSTKVVDFCIIPRTSPHYAGAHDPIAVIALLASGELITLSFPNAVPISPTNQLHVSLSFIHPFVTAINLVPIERSQWLGMTENRSMGPPILKGGASSFHPRKRFEHRNVVQTAHADGTIQLWDAGHGDDLENDTMLQVDVARAVGRQNDVEIAVMSLAGATGEIVAGLRSGEVVIWRWGHNKSSRDPPAPEPNQPRALTNITGRKDPQLTDGLMPFTLFDGQNGPVTAVKLSDVGFVAAAFEGGDLIVIDLRGPAVILEGGAQDFIKTEKRASYRKGSGRENKKGEYVTTLEFSVMTSNNDEYSSILLHAGTNLGHLITFKLLPEPSGRYQVEFDGFVALNDRVVRIYPMNAESGRPAYASQSAVSNLRNGHKVNGVLVAVTASEARIFRPASSKGAHKTWDNVFCDAAAVCRYEDKGYVLLGLFGDGFARGYSLPGLKEIGSVKVCEILDVKRFSSAQITSTGDIIGWLGPSELGLINIWGNGLDLTQSKDTLYNIEALIPPRPTISNFQWVSGTQHITPLDLDLIIWGTERPPSKRMIAQARADEQQRRAAGAPGASSSSLEQGDESYWAYMQRQLNERTEKLNIVGDSMQNLQQSSAGWADDVSKFVAKQKRGLVMGAVKSKFGF